MPNDAPDPERSGVIGFRTAMALFALLAAVSFAALKGIALAFALIVIAGLAAKAWVHHLRSRIE